MNAAPRPAPANTRWRNAPARSATTPSRHPEPSGRSIARPPAARTPTGAGARPGTTTGPVVSARARDRRDRWANCPPPGPHPVNNRESGTRWNPPRPATARTATSRSPSSPCWPPRKPPAPRSPAASRTSLRCGGHREHVPAPR
ncbi:hypothetical protein ADK41_01160 [Streptomyces caelestis]|uniref:Uncharacterized protein n=1 Tax=Streptomyces caelestis TaxID=36816 RepID=A0A0M9XB77_9ACTN|nr:hypothetical protein ADK41_01160 [Streptomyces caelestis]